MKKNLFLLLLIPFCATAQIQHLQNFKGEPYCFAPFELHLKQFGRLKGNVHKLIYEQPGIIMGFEYDKKGQLIFGRYYSDGKTFELDRAEIIGDFDKKNNLIGAKFINYYRTSTSELKQGKDVFLKYLHFNEEKDSLSSQVILEVDENDAIEAIIADVIDRKKNIREEFHLRLNEKETRVYLRDSLEIKETLRLKVAQLWLEREDAIALIYTKTFYKENEPIEFNSLHLTIENPDAEMKVSKPQHLTGDSILSSPEDGEFIYDEKGNWTERDFSLFTGDTKTKAKRYIEYWD